MGGGETSTSTPEQYRNPPINPSVSPASSAVSATSNTPAISSLPPLSPVRVIPPPVRTSTPATAMPTAMMGTSSTHIGGPAILTSMPMFPGGMFPIVNGIFPYNMTATSIPPANPPTSYPYQPTGQVIMKGAIGMPSGTSLTVGNENRMGIVTTAGTVGAAGTALAIATTPTPTSTAPMTPMTPATPATPTVLGSGLNFVTPVLNSPYAKMQYDLPASFAPLPILENDPKVNSIYNSIMTANESVRSNFFFPYSILWLMSSSRMREMIAQAMKVVKKRQEQQERGSTPKSPSPSSPVATSPKTPLLSPEQPSTEVDKKLPSLSPSIQPLCAIHNLTPLGDDHRNEVEVLGDLIELIEDAVTRPTLEYISSLLLTISATFISSSLSSKYQQFGISLLKE